MFLDFEGIWQVIVVQTYKMWEIFGQNESQIRKEKGTNVNSVI